MAVRRERKMEGERRFIRIWGLKCSL